MSRCLYISIYLDILPYESNIKTFTTYHSPVVGLDIRFHEFSNMHYWRVLCFSYRANRIARRNGI